MLGMHGSAAANYAVQECDCLIAVGARFDDRVTGKLRRPSPRTRRSSTSTSTRPRISKNVEVDIPVVGDAKDILREAAAADRAARPRAPGWTQIAAVEEQVPLPLRRPADGTIKPQQVIEPLGRLTDHDAIIATGVGQHQMWAAQFYGWRRPRQIITSGGLGTMGFGCPAAIGAQFGNPGKTVIDIDGDGSFSMTMVEVITAVQLPAAGEVRRAGQRLPGHGAAVAGAVLDRRYSGVDHLPWTSRHGRRLRRHGHRASAPPASWTTPSAAMLNHEGPVVLDVEVEPEENVYPMVPGRQGPARDGLGTLA